MHELLSPAAQAEATVTLTVLEGQVLVKSIRDFANMAFTEFATLHAVMPLPFQLTCRGFHLLSECKIVKLLQPGLRTFSSCTSNQS